LEGRALMDIYILTGVDDGEGIRRIDIRRGVGG